MRVSKRIGSGSLFSEEFSFFTGDENAFLQQERSTRYHEFLFHLYIPSGDSVDIQLATGRKAFPNDFAAQVLRVFPKHTFQHEIHNLARHLAYVLARSRDIPM